MPIQSAGHTVQKTRTLASNTSDDRTDGEPDDKPGETPGPKQRRSHTVKPRIVITILPLLLVNIVATFGQLAFILAHTQWPLIAAIMFAISLESIAIFLAYHAHL